MKKPRLTDADRLAIETGLRSGKTVYCIAKELSRPVTTVTREIRARAVESDKGAAYRVTNRCAFRMECQRRVVCAHCLYDGRRQCKFCRQCNSHCPAFVEQRCGRLERPPFVCNGCAEERKCVLRKRYYLHAKAQESYETVLSESRTGANITEGELLLCDRTLRDLTDRGQSILAAMSTTPTGSRSRSRPPTATSTAGCSRRSGTTCRGPAWSGPAGARGWSTGWTGRAASDGRGTTT